MRQRLAEAESVAGLAAVGVRHASVEGTQNELLLAAGHHLAAAQADPLQAGRRVGRDAALKEGRLTLGQGHLLPRGADPRGV